MKKSFLAGAALLLGTFTATGVNAAYISDGASFSWGDYQFYDYEYGRYGNDSSEYRSRSGVLSLDGFDSSLGTLTGVSISYSTNWETGSYVSARDIYNHWGTDYTNGTAEAWNRMRISLLSPSGDVDASTEYERASCSGFASSYPRCSRGAYDSGSFNGDLNAGLPALDAFVDSTLKVGLFQQLWAEASTSDYDSSVYGWNSQNGWNGRVVVTYTYDVPEPSTLFLMSAGLLGLGFTRLRKAKV